MQLHFALLAQSFPLPLFDEVDMATRRLGLGLWRTSYTYHTQCGNAKGLTMLLDGCRNADTLKRLNDTEKALKEQVANAYVNMDLATAERNKGNEVSSLVEDAANKSSG